MFVPLLPVAQTMPSSCSEFLLDLAGHKPKDRSVVQM